MKQTALKIIVAIVCFVAGIALSDYIRSKKADEKTIASEIINEQSAIKIIKHEDLIGTPLPSFSLQDNQGQQRSVDEWQGKVIAINFWATWCPPCIEEIPYFVELQNQYAEQGLQFVGIALEEVDKVNDFASRFQVNYPMLIGKQDVMKLGSQLGNRVGGLPYTVIVDRTGHISFIKQGPLSREDAEAAILAVL